MNEENGQLASFSTKAIVSIYSIPANPFLNLSVLLIEFSSSRNIYEFPYSRKKWLKEADIPKI